MNCQDSRELLIEYSLGQLDPSQTLEVRKHLEKGCHVCAEQLAEITESWANLASDLEPVQPSPDVEQKLLAMIRGQIAPPVELSARSGRRNERSRLLAYLLAASLSGVAVAIVAWKFLPWNATSSERELASAPAEVWGAPGSREPSTGFQTVALEPIAEKQGVHLSVVMNQAASQWHVIGTGLPETADGSFYQIWWETKSGAFDRAAKFPVDESGKGGVIVDLSKDQQAKLAGVWLTLEDSATSERPSENILFRAAIK